MTHTQYLANALQNIYDGTPWIDVTLASHLKDVNAQQAVQRIKGSNCIWQIVNHIVFWHQRAMRFINHEKPEQDGDLPDFYMPENHGEANWQATLHRLEHSFELMSEAILSFPEEKLCHTLPGTEHMALYYLQGLVEHDAYHLGQIVLLHKYQ
jgi:hypothetical protein